MTEWFTSHAGLWDKLWQVLERGVTDGRHPARLPGFATVSPEGWPEARTVVLRATDKEAGVVSVHTDLYSDKIASLRAHPQAALLVWDPEEALQIRLRCGVAIASGEAVRALWERVPDHAQQSYGVTPAPGTVIPDALAYDKTPDPASFAVLTCRAVAIDAVHLGTTHRRARFTRDGDWQAEWLSP